MTCRRRSSARISRSVRRRGRTGDRRPRRDSRAAHGAATRRARRHRARRARDRDARAARHERARELSRARPARNGVRRPAGELSARRLPRRDGARSHAQHGGARARDALDDGVRAARAARRLSASQRIRTQVRGACLSAADLSAERGARGDPARATALRHAALVQLFLARRELRAAQRQRRRHRARAAAGGQTCGLDGRRRDPASEHRRRQRGRARGRRDATRRARERPGQREALSATRTRAPVGLGHGRRRARDDVRGLDAHRRDEGVRLGDHAARGGARRGAASALSVLRSVRAPVRGSRERAGRDLHRRGHPRLGRHEHRDVGAAMDPSLRRIAARCRRRSIVSSTLLLALLLLPVPVLLLVGTRRPGRRKVRVTLAGGVAARARARRRPRYARRARCAAPS